MHILEPKGTQKMDKVSLFNNIPTAVKQKATKILQKSKYFSFFEQNLHNFDAINKYTGFNFIEEFAGLDAFDSLLGLREQINYACWFVTDCILSGYSDCSYEFDNDLESFLHTIEFAKNELSADESKKLLCEIKYFLVAYRLFDRARVE